MFTSTKIIELGSCAFRQPQADSHCRFLHGYRLTAKFWFSAKHLDQNNWVVDFGGLKGLKKMMQDQFDHTTCISKEDPKLMLFKQMSDAGVCDLKIMDGVGIEKFAEYCHTVADKYVDELTDGRCNCVKVEVFEHENNSAIFEMWNSSTSGALYMNTKAEELSKLTDDRVEKPVKNVKQDNNVELGGRSSDLYNKKQINKWIDPGSTNTWGI